MGQPHERWSAVATSVSCRATAPGSRRSGFSQGERSTERMRESYDVTHRVFVDAAYAEDIREDDEIVVRDQDGRLILPQARILLKRVVYAGGSDPHHVELDCSALRGPQ